MIQKYGVGKIYVGTGKEAAKKAKEMGAGGTILDRIRNGKQDYYNIRKESLPLGMKKREVSHDVERQKDFERKKIIVGTGKESALKAHQMGAGRAVCERIYNGKQDFFFTCYNVKSYDIGGFPTNITLEIARKAETEVAKYTQDKNVMKDVSQEVLIQVAAKKNINNIDSFVVALAKKYVSLFFKTNGFMRSNPKEIYIEDYGGYLI